MASLREIKDRIGSVKATLKITSAMKLVSSAKLHKSQRAIEAMRPYEQALGEILSVVRTARDLKNPAGAAIIRVHGDPNAAPGKTAVVAISSNSSLCGAFNANIAKLTLDTVRKSETETVVFPIGRKVADVIKRTGLKFEGEYSDLVMHPSYSKTAELACALVERYRLREFDSVLLVYNKFISTSVQQPTVEQYLPSTSYIDTHAPDAEEYIFEPDAAETASDMLSQFMCIKLHAAVLDSVAAEQAARTIAMQTASDNGERLLSDLTLEYNKGRQQKITSEILDLTGASVQ